MEEHYEALQSSGRRGNQELKPFMKILVIGGTSFIGPFVVRQLDGMGHGVSVFHRGKTNSELPPGTEEILGEFDISPTL